MKHFSLLKNRKTLLLFLFLLFSIFGISKNNFSLDSPYETVVTHLSNLEEDNYFPSIAALTLAGDQYSLGQKVGLALKLKEIINHCDLDLGTESKKKLLLAIQFKQEYILCKDQPSVYLKKEGKEWKYSPETVSKITEIYEDLFGGNEAIYSKVKTEKTDPKNTTTPKDTTTLDSLQNKQYIFSMKSPYHTIKSYMYFTQKNNYHPEIASQLIYAPLMSKDDKIGVVEKFRQVAINLGLKINIETISRNPNYTDSEYEDHRFILSRDLKELYLIKEDSNWYLSNSSVDFILQKHKEIFFLGTNRLNDLAEILQNKVAGQEELIEEEHSIKKWKKLSFVLIVLILIIAYLAITKILQLLTKLFFKHKNYLNNALRLYPPLVAMALLLSFSIILPSLGLNLKPLKFLINFTNMFWVSLMLISLFRLIDLIIIIVQEQKSVEKNAHKRGLAPFFGMFAKVIAITVATLYILQTVGIDLKTFLTGLSIGGLTLALAAQDSLKNFFGSVMIFLDRPFQIGDWIVSDNISGDVESIGLRSTRIRTFHNSLITVPNSKLADFTLDNMGKRRFRRFKTIIKLKYDTPPEQIDAFTKKLQLLIEEYPKTYSDKYHIHLNDYGKYSLDILFYIFLDVPTWAAELECRHDIMLKTIILARELNIEFADPLSSRFFDGKDML